MADIASEFCTEKTTRYRTEEREGRLITRAVLIEGERYDRLSLFTGARVCGGFTVDAGRGRGLVEELGFQDLEEL
ncbi:MAG: hypothetical protein GWN84_20715 [Gammaproteobacteria bacterium]|nr:hypothetical protein [Gammaproteobacteria bacterium]NIR85184.1 hypothetical protein [Gammaproteobacteria bacterium]NIU06233.1 hypothetical protein [Gammaproteobacteria bacterium]NIX87506.1 hypothetical protein [Gammaproteobacteria bacterium]